MTKYKSVSFFFGTEGEATSASVCSCKFIQPSQIFESKA
jgi:hypothetical protein